MNYTSISVLINLFLFSIISVQLISSASFPNPPQRPPSNATPEEHALFWKLLHNYYAIIARPRFGKRFDSTIFSPKHPSYIETVNSDSMPLFSSKHDINRMLNEDISNANDQQINFDNFYSFEYPDQRRRRRR